MARTLTRLPGRDRLKVSPGMPAGPAAVFKRIVVTVSPDHFSEVDRPLLDQYAHAAHLASKAAAAIEAEGAVLDGKTNPWVGVLEKASRACVALAARLRICPQSRFDRQRAGTNERPQFDDFDDHDGLLAK